jgi:hypothetical protein
MTDADRPVTAPNAAERAADMDREVVAERLRVAATEGRIEPWELDDRLGRAYRAKTHGDLATLVADLPVETLVLRTTTPNIKQAGRWTVPPRITAESTTGWITIDFTQACCAPSPGTSATGPRAWRTRVPRR